MAGKRTNRKKRTKQPPPKTPKNYEPLTNEEISEGRGIDVINGRITFPQQDKMLRRAFMIWEEGWRKRTEKSTRPELNNLAITGYFNEGKLQIPAYHIDGNAKDVHTFPNGDRKLLISQPRARNKDGEIITIDDHLWLNIDKCINATHLPFDIRYGDFLCARIAVKAFIENGIRRLGTEQWMPVHSCFYYYDEKAKHFREIPNIFGDDSLLVRFKACEDTKEEMIAYAKPEAQIKEYTKRLAEEYPTLHTEFRRNLHD